MRGRFKGGEISARDEYQAGVPCWVDTFQSDPDVAVGFYAELLGWEVDGRRAPDSWRKYLVCKLRGREVAGVRGACPRPVEGMPPDWNTHVRVESVEEVAAKTAEAGGSVTLGPFDSLEGGGWRCSPTRPEP